MKETRLNDAVVFNDALDADFLSRPAPIAYGRHKHDMQWRNTVGSLRDVIVSLTQFEYGPKDGRCLLQGEVADQVGYVRRQMQNMRRNHLMIHDYDKGETIEDIADKIYSAGLFAMLWTTHSNMKTRSFIPEKKIEAYMKQIGCTGQQATDEQVLDFLTKTEKLLPFFTENGRVVGKEFLEGGVKYVVEHPPLPRLRGLFALSEPFDFAVRGGSQAKAMEEWKERYGGLAEKFDLPTPDNSCVDPSRLMYTPRLPDGATGTIWIIDGEPLDIDMVPRKMRSVKKVEKRNVFETVANANMGKKRDTLETGYILTRSWLRKFIAVCGPYFEIARWLQSEHPEDVRREGNSKCDFRCPNEDGHTIVSDQDTAFCVWDGDGDSSFGASCRHDSCIAESGEDRIWYLDKLCELYGIDDPEQLVPFLMPAGHVAWVEAKQKDAQKDAQKQRMEEAKSLAEQQASANETGATGPIDFALGALHATPTTEELQRLYTMIAALPMKSDRDKYARPIKDKTGISVTAIRADIEAARDRFVASENAATGRQETMEDTNVPDNDQWGDEGITIWCENNNTWTPNVQDAITARQIEDKNKKEPRLFRRPEGGVVRAVYSNGELAVGELDDDAWRFEIGRLVQFKKLTQTGVRVLDPPKERVAKYRGRPDNEKKLPILERVLHTPTFAADGTFVEKRGYHLGMKAWIDPNFEVQSVSLEPSEDDVAQALAILHDVLTDFPFSDVFDGSEHQPIKMTDEDGNLVLDETGHPYPNPDRGAASRANMLALILQPFVQHLIDGNCPAYHLDKASPGTGAGYLADVAFIIATGKRASVSVMSDNNEEFKKNITALLRQGEPLMFVDNINRHVDSGALAAALTSGTWVDRVLGVSEVVQIPVNCVWIMAGNNLTFSHELMRRIVPIRLDAKTPNPALDRGEKDFKHFPLQDVARQFRPDLVWACHTLIANWFAKGRPTGTIHLTSFDNWSRTMGGILEAAGVRDFLRNVPDYLLVNDDEDHSLADFAQGLYDRFGTHPFDIAQAASVAKSPMGAVQFGLPLDPNLKDHAFVVALGKIMTKHMVKATFAIMVMDGPHVDNPAGPATLPPPFSTSRGGLEGGQNGSPKRVPRHYSIAKKTTKSPVKYALTPATKG